MGKPVERQLFSNEMFLDFEKRNQYDIADNLAQNK